MTKREEVAVVMVTAVGSTRRDGRAWYGRWQEGPGLQVKSHTDNSSKGFPAFPLCCNQEFQGVEMELGPRSGGWDSRNYIHDYTSLLMAVYLHPPAVFGIWDLEALAGHFYTPPGFTGLSEAEVIFSSYTYYIMHYFSLHIILSA